MTLLVELKKELRKIELARKSHEADAARLKEKENRLRQLAVEFAGSLPAPASKTAVRKPMSEEHRRKISEALKRRFAKN